MYCKKCGAENVENANFCTVCGEKINSEDAVQNKATDKIKVCARKTKKDVLLIAVIGVIVSGIVGSLFGGIGKRSIEETLEQYINANFDGNAESMAELIHNEMIDYELDKWDYGTEDYEKFIDELEEELKLEKEAMSEYFGNDWDVTYEIISIADLDIEDYEYLMQECYYKDMDIEISGAKRLIIELVVEGKERNFKSGWYVGMFEVGNNWYLDLVHGNLVFNVTETAKNLEATENEAELTEEEKLLEEMEKMYNKNRLKAEDTYLSEYVEISGKIDYISDDYFTIVSDSLRSNDIYIGYVHCYYQNEEHKEFIMNMVRGKNVAVSGRISAVDVMGYKLEIDQLYAN